MLKRILVVLIVTAVLATAGAWFGYQGALKQPLTIAEQGAVVQVQRGQSLNSVLDQLVAQGLLTNTLAAKLYAKQHNLAGQIKVGEFLLPAGTNLISLFEILRSNEQIRYKITLVEGSTFKEALAKLQADERLEHKLAGQSVEEVWQGLRKQSSESEAFLKAQAPKELFYEGMLYPDTYFFHRGDSDLSLLLRAHQRLLDVLAEEWQGKADKLPLKNAYQALILASIVEKETGKPSERAEIAGVFTRRLNKGMRLQTDPTVIYGLGDAYQGNITRKHLKQKTAYNTYRINGLPPTPIALAGREAINAALHPKAGKSLYFVAKGDGSHQFSETIGQHNRAVRQYQLKRRADYRSSHQVPSN